MLSPLHIPSETSPVLHLAVVPLHTSLQGRTGFIRQGMSADTILCQLTRRGLSSVGWVPWVIIVKKKLQCNRCLLRSKYLMWNRTRLQERMSDAPETEHEQKLWGRRLRELAELRKGILWARATGKSCLFKWGGRAQKQWLQGWEGKEPLWWLNMCFKSKHRKKRSTEAG